MKSSVKKTQTRVKKMAKKSLSKVQGELVKEYRCDFCQAVFDEARSLSNHRRSHERKIYQGHPCKLQNCPQRYAKMTGLRRHSEKTNHKVFGCLFCLQKVGVAHAQRYFSEKALRRHQRLAMHTGRYTMLTEVDYRIEKQENNRNGIEKKRPAKSKGTEKQQVRGEDQFLETEDSADSSEKSDEPPRKRRSLRRREGGWGGRLPPLVNVNTNFGQVTDEEGEVDVSPGAMELFLYVSNKIWEEHIKQEQLQGGAVPVVEEQLLSCSTMGRAEDTVGHRIRLSLTDLQSATSTSHLRGNSGARFSNVSSTIPRHMS